MRIPQSKKDKESLVVGLPRAFFYFRYSTLWQTFFKGLNIKTKVSVPTNLDMVNRGTKKAVSEMCLAMKIYLGHVAYLADQEVDYILVPRIRDFGVRRVMCTNFESLPDIVSNTFHDASFKVLTYDIDSSKKMDERDAMIKMGVDLGFKKGEVKKAYKEAVKAQEIVNLKNITETEKNIRVMILRLRWPDTAMSSRMNTLASQF
jgi:predicted nucleotide-binding protein (sugar kinase/HSP70/actin superfamily)